MTFKERLEAARQVLEAASTGQRPVGLADQIEAAGRQAQGLLRRTAELLPREEWHQEERPTSDSLEVRARILVALEDCRVCPHLQTGGPQPVWLLLPLHRADCGLCMSTTGSPPPDEDDRCDWCGSRRARRFRPIILQHHAVVAIGYACPRCAKALLRAGAK